MLRIANRAIALLLLFPSPPLVTLAADAKQVYVNLRADAVFLEPATNSVGKIRFVCSNGINYPFQVEKPDGQIVSDGWFYDSTKFPRTNYMRLAIVEQAVEFTDDIGFGPYGWIRGTVTFKRAAGFSTGVYQVSGPPLGTASGRFHIVEFRGVLREEAGRTYSGALVQRYPYPGVPEQFIIGAGENDEVVGTDAGRNFSVGFSAGQFIASEGNGFPKEWLLMRGTAVYLQESETSGPSIEIQASANVSGPWTRISTFPLNTSGGSEFYRLEIRKQ